MDELSDQGSMGESVADLGERYDITSTRIMHLIEEKKGEQVSLESIAKELVGPEYDEIPESNKEGLISTLIQPDVEEAVEMGLLRATGEGEYEVEG